MDPIVLVFAGLALFIIFKLVSVLGTRTGHETRPEMDPVARGARADAEPAAMTASEEEQAEAPTPVTAAAEPLRAADSAFDEGHFLEGAKAAYEMIVEAFAAGDMRSIRRYLESSVYDAFKSAVSAREESGRTLDLKFVGIENAAIASSTVADGAMTAVVDFVSNQVRATYDREGALVDGDPSRVDLVRDRWTFARPAGTNDPNWTLVATGASA